MGLEFLTDDFINIPDSNSLSFGNAVTDTPVSILAAVVPAVLDGSGLFMLHKGTASAREYSLRETASGKITVNFYDNVFGSRIGQVTDSIVLSVGVLAFIVVTYDGSGTSAGIKIYLNGVLQASSSDEALPYTAMHNQAQPARIGTFFTNPNFTNALIIEIALWGHELSVIEVGQVSNSKVKYMPLQIQPTDLRAYWPMDDGIDGASADGDTVRDLSGNGNDGVGNDGPNNSGLTWTAEEVLSYPPSVMPVSFVPDALLLGILHKLRPGIQEGLRLGL